MIYEKDIQVEKVPHLGDLGGEKSNKKSCNNKKRKTNKK
jgi:hypothetical protein